MTPKHRMLIGLLIFLFLAAQRLQPTENTESQNLTPFQQMQHLIKSNFDNDPNAPKYGKVILISNRSFELNGSRLYLGDYSRALNTLINKAVLRGMREAVYLNRRLKIYSSDVSVEDDMYSSDKKRGMYVPRSGLHDTKLRCIEWIVIKYMEDKSIDILVGGSYSTHFHPSKISLTTFIIDKRVKGVRSEISCYPYEDLTVRDPYSGALLLRSDIQKDITRSVRQLLNYLPEQQ